MGLILISEVLYEIFRTGICPIVAGVCRLVRKMTSKSLAKGAISSLISVIGTHIGCPTDYCTGC